MNQQTITRLAFVLVLVIAGIAHGYNMFNFPYYENDEGTYMSQAHALMTTGQLAHYTYWYDHAPFGWMFIGMWSWLIEPLPGFAFSMNAGRTFMLVLHVLSSALVFGISKKMRAENLPAIIAVLLFSLSPLAVTYQRRVLLDNLMTFWLLVSLFLALGSPRSLLHYVTSAFAFAFAVLSKESAVFFAPAVLFVVFFHADRRHRGFAVGLWLAFCFLVCAFYPLYAILNGELFPVGHPLGSSTGSHVSLLETLQYQASREGGYFLEPDSAFGLNFSGWVYGGQDNSFLMQADPDPPLMIGGIIGTLLMTILSVFRSNLRPITLAALLYWLFLIRGGVVIGFYIVPLIPFLGLCIGLSVQALVDLVRSVFPVKALRFVAAHAVVGICAVPFIMHYGQTVRIYTSDQTTVQRQAVEWFRVNVDREAFILIDNYAFLDFYGSFEQAHYYWKADEDPEINQDLLDDNWCNVDYLLTTPQLIYDAQRNGLDLVAGALNNSEVVMRYAGDAWDIEVRKVHKDTCGEFVME